MVLELRVLDRVREIPEATWNALVGPDDSPFVEHTWLDCLEEAGCASAKQGWLPAHAALYEDGELVALAPTYMKTSSEGEFVFDWSWADLARRIGTEYYPKLVTAVPFTPATGARVLTRPGDDRALRVSMMARALVQAAPEIGAHGVHALFPTEAEVESWVAAGYLLRYGIQYHFRNKGYATFEDFLKTLPSKKRTQIRREAKQPAKDGVVIERLGPDDYTPAVTRRMFELYLTTVDKFMWGRRYLNLKFFELLVERFRHRLAWVVAKKDGDIIAGAFNVERGKRLYGRYWGATVDLPFLHFNVCYYHGIEECIARGLEVFEPGAGGEHKRARGFDPTITYSAHWIQDLRMRGILRDFVIRERAAIEAHVAAGGEGEEP
jgi:predicted N-acyltransferase